MAKIHDVTCPRCGCDDMRVQLNSTKSIDNGRDGRVYMNTQWLKCANRNCGKLIEHVTSAWYPQGCQPKEIPFHIQMRLAKEKARV